MVSVSRFLFSQFLRYPIYIPAIATAIVNSILMKYYIPKLIGLLTSSQASRGWVIWHLIVSYILTEFLFFRFWEYVTDVFIGPRLRASVTNEAVGQLLKAKFQYHEQNAPAELITKITLLERAHDVIEVTINRLIADPIGIFIAMYAVWQRANFYALTTSAFCIFIFICCMSYIGSKETIQLGEEATRIYAKNINFKVDLIRNIFNIKIFSTTEQQMCVLKSRMDEERSARVALERRMLLIRGVMWASYTLSHCMILFFMYKDQSSIGDLLFVNRILDSLKFPIASIAYRWSRLVHNVSEISQGLQIYNLR